MREWLVSSFAGKEIFPSERSRTGRVRRECPPGVRKSEKDRVVGQAPVRGRGYPPLPPQGACRCVCHEQGSASRLDRPGNSVFIFPETPVFARGRGHLGARLARKPPGTPGACPASSGVPGIERACSGQPSSLTGGNCGRIPGDRLHVDSPLLCQRERTVIVARPGV